MENVILKGDCLVEIKKLDDCSIDSIVTDPPYELGFMGKKWDASGIAYQVELWEECLRVLKAGGHLLAFGGSRTYHRMAVAIEDSGFEIRDSIHWTYGSGFPKSLDVSKAIDKAAGADRKVVGKGENYGASKASDGKQAYGDYAGEWTITAPATPAAQQWQGWGTALKPSHEPIVVARKPLHGTVASNVLEHGTGALNIDGCRIGTDGGTAGATAGASDGIYGNGLNGEFSKPVPGLGRWPANTILTHSTGCQPPDCVPGCPAREIGEPSRFFYQTEGWDPDWDLLVYIAKASKRERNAGLDGLPKKQNKFGNQNNGKDIGNGSVNDKFTNTPNQNFHPTVKPVALMRYLVKLITPPNGIVLDPFLGSGTTAVAATLEGFKWIGCEMTEDYYTIIEGRVAHAQAEYKKQTEQLELTNE